jgi:hypothetical protein
MLRLIDVERVFLDRAGSMNSRSPNRPYVIVLTRFPGGEPHTIRLKALQVVRPDRDPL